MLLIRLRMKLIGNRLCMACLASILAYICYILCVPKILSSDLCVLCFVLPVCVPFFAWLWALVCLSTFRSFPLLYLFLSAFKPCLACLQTLSCLPLSLFSPSLESFLCPPLSRFLLTILSFFDRLWVFLSVKAQSTLGQTLRTDFINWL